MVRLIVPLDVQLRAVERREGLEARAYSTAASWTPQQMDTLDREFQRNPTLPPDVFLAAASDPNASSTLFDNLSLANADMPQDFAQGDVVEAQMWRHAMAQQEADIRRQMAAGYGQKPETGFRRMLSTISQIPSPIGINGNTTLGDYVSSAGRMLPGGLGQAAEAGARLATDGPAAELDRYSSMPGALGSVADGASGLVSGGQAALGFGRRAVTGAVGLVPGAPEAISAGSDALYETAKGSVRESMPGLDAPWQLIQARGRTAFSGRMMMADGDFWGGLNRAGEALSLNPASQALRDGPQLDFAQQVLARGEQLGQLLTEGQVTVHTDLGDGFFYNLDSQVVERRQRAERAMGTLPNGETITIGRGVAYGLGFEPEGAAYDVVSGLFDAAVMVGIPGVEGSLGRGLSSARQAGIRRAGGFSGLYRGTDLPTARSWIRSGESQPLVDWLVSRNGPSGFSEIYRRTRGSLDSSANPFVTRNLAEASSPEQVRQILDNALLSGSVPTFRTTPATGLSEATNFLGDTRFFRESGLRRLRGLTPRLTTDPSDFHSNVEQVYDWGRNVKAPDSVMDDWAWQMSNARDEISRTQVAFQMQGWLYDDLVRRGIGGAEIEDVMVRVSEELVIPPMPLPNVRPAGPEWWDELGRSLKIPEPGDAQRALTPEVANEIWSGVLGEGFRDQGVKGDWLSADGQASLRRWFSMSGENPWPQTYLDEFESSGKLDELHAALRAEYGDTVVVRRGALVGRTTEARTEGLTNASLLPDWMIRTDPFDGDGAWRSSDEVYRSVRENFRGADNSMYDALDESFDGILEAARANGFELNQWDLDIARNRLHDLSGGFIRARLDEAMYGEDVPSHVDGVIDWMMDLDAASYRSSMGKLEDLGISIGDPRFEGVLDEIMLRADEAIAQVRLEFQPFDDAHWIAEVPVENIRGLGAADEAEVFVDVAMEAMSKPARATVTTEQAAQIVRNDDRARRLTRMWTNDAEQARVSFDRMLQFGPEQWSNNMLNAVESELPGMHLLSQHATQIPWGDYRQLRRATSFMAPIYETVGDSNVFKSEAANILRNSLGPLWETTVDSLTTVQGWWKKMKLLRLGYPLRTWVMDEGMRMYIDGQTGLTHPGGFFAWALDPSSTRVGESNVQALDRLRGVLGTADGSVEGVVTAARSVDRAKLFEALNDPALGPFQDVFLRSDFDDVDSLRKALDDLDGLRSSMDGGGLHTIEAYNASLMDERLGGQINRVTELETGPYQRISRNGANPEGYVRGWRSSIMYLASDPAASRVARKGVDATFETLTNTDEGAIIWRRLIGLKAELEDPTTLRQYLKTVSNEIEAVTGGSDDLLQVIRVGRFDESIDLAGLAAQQIGPNTVVARHIEMSEDSMRGLDDLLNRAFDAFQTRPSNRFRRGPVWEREWERRLIELAPLADDKAELLASARRANVTAATMTELERTGASVGSLKFEHIDQIAAKGAHDHTKQLLFDVTRSSNFFDLFRLMFPFGDAWREVVTTYGRLVSQQPFRVIEAGGRAGRAASSEDFGETFREDLPLNFGGGELVDAEGNQMDAGFFYPNQFDELVFYYPWSQEFSRFISSRGRVDIPGTPFSVPSLGGNGTGGFPVRMEGTLAGSNVVGGEIFPGLGPVGQIPANDILPRTSEWTGIRDLLFPFGEPDSMMDLTTMLPTWMGTAIRGNEQLSPEQIRLFGSTQVRVMRQLYSTGDYTGSDGYDRLLADSAEIAPLMFFTRAVGQFFAPSSPQMAYQMIGANGDLATQSAVIDRYNTLREEDPENALELFITEVGPQALLAIQGGTVNKFPGGTPMEGAAWEWVQDNPEVARLHPEVHGFFAPTGEGEEFSMEAYRASLENGQRVVLRPEEVLQLANNSIASMLYRNLVDGQATSNPSPEQILQRDNYRAFLMEAWPGFNRTDGIGGRPSAASLIDSGKVDKALEDPVLSSTPVGEALAEYWRFRGELFDQMNAAGIRTGSSGGWRTANAGEPYRNALRQAGDELVRLEPGFARMWEMFLSQEFKREEDEE